MAENLLVSTGAADDVGFELNTFQNSAWYAIGEARDALDQMALLRPVFPEGAAQAGTAIGNITYNPPSGGAPTWNFVFNPPEWNIPSPVLSDVNKTVVEDFTGSPPAGVTPNIPQQPVVEPVTAPGDAPLVSNVVIPDFPELAEIADPTELAITIPAAPVVNIDSFYAKKPTEAITVPSGDFTWSEDPYTSDTLTQIVSTIGNYFAGGVGIPNEIWEAIWARENDRENRAGLKQIDEINEEWSSRGFQLPQGVQIDRVDEVYQNLQNASSERAKEIAIKEASLEIENLRFAVQQGIALETLRGSWHQATQARLFEASKYTYELAISILNAEIGLYNSQVQMYLAEVQVYRADIEAELSKLEVYKSELDGQRIIGDLNLQQVQIYTAKVQALNLDIDRYNAILQGIKTTVDVDTAKIDAYKTEVQAYGEKLNAISIEYQAYNSAMQGAKIEADIHATNVSAFTSTVQAYSSKIDAAAKSASIDIDINKYKLEEYNMKLQGFISNLDAEIKNLQAESTAFDAKVKGYVSEIDSERANMNAQVTQYTADIQLASQTTQVNIANAETNARNALAEAGIIQQGLDSIAKVNGAYAGSALAAANISMSISDHASNSSADY